MKHVRWILALISIILFLSIFHMCTKSSSQSTIKNEYNIARDANWYPLFLMGKSANLLAFSDEVLKNIGKAEGVSFNLYSSSYDNLFRGLEKEEFDAILSPIYPIKYRQTTYLFSNPYFYTGPVIIVPEKSNALSLNSLSNKIVGLMQGSQSILSLEKFPSIIVKTYDNITLALENMNNDNSLDAVIMNLVPAFVFCNNIYYDQLKVSSPPLTDEGIRLLVLKGSKNEKLIKIFNDGLQKIKDDGTYDRLLNKWGLNQGLPPTKKNDYYFGNISNKDSSNIANVTR